MTLFVDNHDYTLFCTDAHRVRPFFHACPIISCSLVARTGRAPLAPDAHRVRTFLFVRLPDYLLFACRPHRRPRRTAGRQLRL